MYILKIRCVFTLAEILLLLQVKNLVKLFSTELITIKYSWRMKPQAIDKKTILFLNYCIVRTLII